MMWTLAVLRKRGQARLRSLRSLRWCQSPFSRAGGGAGAAAPEAGADTLSIPQKAGNVVYRFADGTVWRKGAADKEWKRPVKGAAVSKMWREARTQVAVWHWDLELRTRSDEPRVRPLFSFEAVTAKAATAESAVPRQGVPR